MPRSLLRSLLRSPLRSLLGLGAALSLSASATGAQPALAVQAEVTKLRGPLPADDLSTAFDASPSVAACFDTSPDVDTAKVALSIRRNGTVSSAKVTTLNRARDRAFERCVASSARAASFDAASRSTTATLTLSRTSSVTDFLDSVDRDPSADATALTAAAPPRPVDVIAAKIHRDYTAGIRHCYNAALKRDATLRGSASVTVDIATSGAVTKATVTGMPAVASCIERLASRWHFGPIDTGTSGSVSFNLSP